MKYFTVVLLMMFVLLSCTAEGSQGISGELQSGLRVLPVDSGDKNLEFTIYRGDYIVFEFENTGTVEFRVPALDIDTTMPRPEAEKSYVKMKKSGDYTFTLGDRQGLFHVLELEEPNYQEVTAAEAVELLTNVNPLVIDVRTAGEFASGHISGANLLPVQILADNLQSLEKFKDDDILLYCASGNRSTVAARILIDAGFTKVYNLRYGMGDWIRKGMPVE